jgi:hypothetical protein
MMTLANSHSLIARRARCIDAEGTRRKPLCSPEPRVGEAATRYNCGATARAARDGAVSDESTSGA